MVVNNTADDIDDQIFSAATLVTLLDEMERKKKKKNVVEGVDNAKESLKGIL